MIEIATMWSLSLNRRISDPFNSLDFHSQIGAFRDLEAH